MLAKVRQAMRLIQEEEEKLEDVKKKKGQVRDSEMEGTAEEEAEKILQKINKKMKNAKTKNVLEAKAIDLTASDLEAL